MLKYEGRRKKILQRLWLMASCGCCLAVFCMLCCKDCHEFGGAEVHLDSGILSG